MASPGRFHSSGNCFQPITGFLLTFINWAFFLPLLQPQHPQSSLEWKGFPDTCPGAAAESSTKPGQVENCCCSWRLFQPLPILQALGMLAVELQGVMHIGNGPNVYHYTRNKLPWCWAGSPFTCSPLIPGPCISQEQPQGPQKLLSALVPPKQGRWDVNLGSCAPTVHPAPCGISTKNQHSLSTSQAHRTTAKPPRKREDGHSPSAGSQGSPGEVPLSLCSTNHLLLHIRNCSTRSACSKHSSTGTSRNLSVPAWIAPRADKKLQLMLLAGWKGAPAVPKNPGGEGTWARKQLGCFNVGWCQ